MNGMRRRYARESNRWKTECRAAQHAGIASGPFITCNELEEKMKDKNVVKVDFKAKRKEVAKESASGKCCQHLEKCAGHSFNG